MLALDVGRLAFWLFISLTASLVALGIAVVCGFAAASINRSKGRSPRAGFWLGFCLPLVALAVAALLPRRSVPADRAAAVPSRRVLTRLAIGVGAASLLVPVAGIVVYTQFINDPEPKLDTNDLADLVGGGDTASTSSAGAVAVNAAMFTATATTEPSDETTESSEPVAAECAAESASTGSSVPDDTTATTESADTSAASADGFDGEWAVTTDSEFGYRVAEVLAGIETEAVGRGNEIAGSFTVSGTDIAEACFVVQVASITSDESMRDGQFNSRIMETETYPTATFVLTEPIVLDALPEVGGDAITATATGDLTLHGATNSVTFEATVQAGDGVIGVLGEIPVVFADYSIADPSGGPAEVGEDGVLEFLLAFEPA